MGAFSSGSFDPLAFSGDAFDLDAVVSPGVPLTLLTRSGSNTFVLPNFSPTPNCFTAFSGEIDITAAYQGLLNDSSTAVLGQLYPIARFEGIIDASSTAFNGLLTDNEPFNGSLTDKAGFQGIICNC
jgi:hypothetical protein